MQDKSSLKFADRLRMAMANCGLKASGLAGKAGVSKGYLSELLAGAKDSPSPEAVKKIADVLCVSPAWLLTGNGSHPVSAQSSGYPKEPGIGETAHVVREDPAVDGEQKTQDLSVDERLKRVEALLSDMAAVLRRHGL